MTGHFLRTPRIAAALILVAGCGGSPTSPPPPPPPPSGSVATVTVTPDSVNLKPGDKAQLTATVRDPAGNALAGRAVAWSSSNSTIATVSLSGVVSAVTPGGPVQITASSGERSGASQITVVPPSNGTIGAQGGTLGTPNGTTVTVSVGAFSTPLSVQAQDAQAEEPRYSVLSPNAVRVVIPITTGAFQQNGSVQVSIPISRAVQSGGIAYVRARFKGVPGEFWAPATSVGGGRLTLSMPTNGFSDYKSVLGLDTLDVVLDAEEFTPAPTGSLRGGISAGGRLSQPVASLRADCPFFPAANDPANYSPCGGRLFRIRAPQPQPTGTKTRFGIVLVHGWLSQVATGADYYDAQGLQCTIVGLNSGCVAWSTPSQPPANRDLPGQAYFKTLIDALEPQLAGQFGGAPLYVFDYQSFNHFSVSGDQFANELVRVKAADNLDGFVVIGHSMGGLVARSAATLLENSSGKAQTLLGLITLATPHEGTRLADARVASTWLLGPPSAGTSSLLPTASRLRTETVRTILYGGNINGANNNVAGFHKPFYIAGHTLLCGLTSCDNDGVVPVASAFPVAFSPNPFVIFRSVLARYDHSQVKYSSVPNNDPEALYTTIVADLTLLLQRAGAGDLIFSPQPRDGTTLIPLPILSVVIRDTKGQPITGRAAPVTLTVNSGPSGAVLGGTRTSVTDNTGRATFSDLTLDRAGTYTLSASAFGLFVTSASFTVSTTPQVPTVPLAPSGLASSAAQAQVSLAWNDNSNNEDGFRVERAPGGTTSWVEIGVAGVGVSVYADQTVAAGASYSYRVRAYNAAGNSAYSNSVTASTPAASAPSIALDRTTVPFTFVLGGSAPSSQVVNVTNGGTGSLTGLSLGSVAYTAGQPTGWLNPSMTPTTAPSTITLAVVPAGVPAGSYSATLPVSSSAVGVANSPRSITVTMTVSASAQAPTINLSATTATFNATVGGPNPATQNTIVVSNSGTGGLTGMTAGPPTYQAGQPTGWLVPTLTSSTAPATLTLTALTGALSAGSYSASVPVVSSAVGVTNSPRNVVVTFIVAPGQVALVSVSAGNRHTCGLTAAGAAYCWGVGNPLGGLGDGTATDRSTPVIVAGGFTFTNLAGGGYFTCGRTAAGTGYCWGDDRWGQLGDGKTADRRFTPVPILGGLAFVGIEGGNSHACGVAAVGTAYCWGANATGFGGAVLGDGTATDRYTPTAVAGGLVFSSINAGVWHTCGLTPSGAAYCWGANWLGQLGDGTTASSTAPVRVAGGSQFSDLSVGQYFTCGLATSGAIYCWGANQWSLLGDPNLVPFSNTPTLVQGGLSFAKIAAGWDHLCGLTSTGAAYCWGTNGVGQLGDGTTTDRTTFVPVVGGHVFTSLTIGESHTCGVVVGGGVYCWGYNVDGQLGDGTTVNRATPVLVRTP